MNAWQVGFIEPDVFIVFERIGQDAALLDLYHQTLDIDALVGGATRRQKINRRREEVAGAEDVALLDVVASRCQFYQAMEKFSGLPRLEWDQLFEIVMASQKFATVEELDPPL